MFQLRETFLTQKLHQRALSVVADIRKYEAELLELLEKIDRRKGYMELGCSSLFQYVVERLGLSESRAYNFITVTRKAREIPELKEGVKQGKYSVSKARKVTPVLNKQNKEEWLVKAELLSQKLLEREVAKINPQLKVIENSRYVSAARLELKMGVSEEVMEEFKRAQDLVSQNKKKAVNFEDTLEELLRFYLAKKDPVEKADRSGKKNTSKGVFLSIVPSRKIKKIRKSPVARQVTRSPVPAAIQHQVFLRDKGKCQFRWQGLGRPCSRGRWIHLHHIKPVAEGGAHSVDNLLTLCSEHHAWVHKQGPQFVYYQKKVF